MSRQYKFPEEIYAESYEIIMEGLSDLDVSDDDREIFKRIAHASADIDFAKTFVFGNDGVRRGVEAIRSGGNVLCDVRMVLSGIRKKRLGPFGGEADCYLYRPETAEEAGRRGTTRAAAAISLAAEFMNGGIVAIGNAPTALFELIDLMKEGTARPALVVGVPVGFVGAAESKEELRQQDIPFITNPGRRGGSPIAAAITNGLIYLAGEGR